MRLRRFLTPGWFVVHLALWGAAVAMVLLGRWQLRVSNAKHFDLQNFGYSIQWWLFAACALYFWVRLLRDAGRPSSGTDKSGELVVRPGTAAASYVGPAELITPPKDGQDPVVYRGYVIPQSATSPHRSEDDPHHAAYNDYLWQLGLADQAERRDPRT